MTFGKLFSLGLCLFCTTLLSAQTVRINGGDLEPHVREVLQELGRKAGVDQLTVRQKERTAVDQARVMYKALLRYKNQGKDGHAILLRQYGDAALPTLNAFKEYLPQGKDLTIEYMAFNIEETVKKLRSLPETDPNHRGFIYVLPLDYHLVEIDIRSLPEAEAFRKILASMPQIIEPLTLEPSAGQGRSCKNCYLIAIRRGS